MNIIKFKKYIILFCVLIFSLSSLSGCYDAEGIEALGYVVAIGLDKGTSNTLKLSLQFAILEGSSSSGSSTSQSSKSNVISVECASFDSGINLINSYISKKINLAHCKVIVLSEDLAYDGISDYVFSFMNNVELRPDCNIIISRCSASDLLNNSKPTLETLSARYYELIPNSSEYTAYTENVTIAEFYNNILNYGSQAYAILGGINTKNNHSSPSNTQTPYDIDANYKAGQTPMEGKVGLENMGLAVFNGDNLVGELNGIETISHLIITNNLKNATVTLPSPFKENSTISLYISLTKNTKNSVQLINKFPYIKSRIYITATILSFDENLDYANEDNLKSLEEYLNSYLKQNIEIYLYKTSKEYHSDIANFGKYTRKYYATWEDWINSAWLDNYQNAFFDVDVNSNVQSGYLFTKI